MDAAVHRRRLVASELLLEHCNALDPDARPTARARLEALLGTDLARRLVEALSPRR